MKGKELIKQAIDLLEKVYDENEGGSQETGNYGDSFSQGCDCGEISAILTILRSHRVEV